MSRLRDIAAVAGIVLLTCVSCRTIPSLFNDGQVVARVGRHRLYKSDIDNVIPHNLPSQDSVAMAMRYIDSWASDLVFLDVAEEHLSKADKDVSRELEDYRQSLLKYRYEQQFVNERLDTAVTDSEIEAYYQEHRKQFVLEVPIVKTRYMRISTDSPNLEVIKKKMSSSDVDELLRADSLAYFSAEKYTDYSGKWIDMLRLARNFGTDYGTLLSRIRNSVVEMEDGNGKTNLAFIADFISAGEIPPLEYCSDRIRDIIVSIRKQALISDLERDLLEDARKKGKFEVL